jgi:hypothetical protein
MYGKSSPKVFSESSYTHDQYKITLLNYVNKRLNIFIMKQPFPHSYYNT